MGYARGELRYYKRKLEAVQAKIKQLESEGQVQAAALERIAASQLQAKIEIIEAYFRSINS